MTDILVMQADIKWLHGLVPKRMVQPLP